MVAILLPLLLLAASVASFHSSKERLEARVAAHTSGNQSVPLKKKSAHGARPLAQANATATSYYSPNWAGAMYNMPGVCPLL
jgi:hypothetical protein